MLIIAKAPYINTHPTRCLIITALVYLMLPIWALAQSPPADQKCNLATHMEQARVALSNNDFTLAINLYTKIIAANDAYYKILALEFLGVAREKNNQLAHAKSIYQQFLKQYPHDKSASRVRQRLNAMITAANRPKDKLRGIDEIKTKTQLEWSSFGGFSQYYRYADLTLKDSVSNPKIRVDIESSLSSDLFYAVRGRNEKWDLQLRFGGGYLNNFLPDTTDKDRLSELYVDIENRDTGHAIRVGRQRGRSAGVLGRFDGIFSTIAFSDTYQLHLIYGYPVLSTNDIEINSAKTLYGINFDFGPYLGWEITPFYVEQRTKTLTDRKAAGFETRYFDERRTLFTLIDYDIDFNELNSLLAIGSWRVSNATTITTNIDLRKSPILTISNALQGQPETTLEELSMRFDKNELQQLAKDRTTDSTLISMGIHHRLNKFWGLYSSATMNKISDMPASGGIEALPGTDNEWSYDIQFISSSLIKDNDSGIFSLRYFDGTMRKITAANFDFRYPINQYFRINPRFRVNLRQNTNDSTDQWAYRPSIKSTYRYHKKFHFEIELGGEWNNRELAENNEEKSKGFFGTIGYRVDL